ncbi:MAG: ABC transporter permease subunit [Ruminiclostridium sp.]|nr:ABC transporter permease subunit [Ruminiclostridium sp.]
MRKNTKTIDLIIVVVLLLIAAGTVLALLPQNGRESGTGVSADANNDGKITNDDYNGKRAGIITGSMHDKLVTSKLEGCTLYNFNTYTDMITALKSDKIDFFLAGTQTAVPIVQENPDLSYINEPLDVLEVGAMFAKDENGEKLRDQFNVFLAKLFADGTRDKILDFWLSDESKGAELDYSDLTGENGTLVLATTGNDPPISFISNGRNVGFDIDIAVRFCREYGYGLDIVVTDFGGIIPGIVTGMYDFAMDDAVITEERKESVYFSDPYNYCNMNLVVKKADISSQNAPALSDYSGKKIGVQTGTTFDGIVKASIPDADICYFNSYTDMLMALNAGSIDAFGGDEPIVKYMMNEYSSVAYLSQYMDSYEFGFAFPKTEKGKDLCDKASDFIRKIRADGTLEEIEGIWFGNDETRKTIPDAGSLDARNGVLKLATEASASPFVYMSGNGIAGYEIDIAYRFCKEYGYGLQIEDMNFDAIIPAVQSEMCDFGASCMTMTKERAESVYFSEPEYSGGAVLAVKAADIADTNIKTVPAVTLDQLNSPDRSVGVWTGASGMIAVEKYLPEAKELMFDSIATALEAVRTGQTDAFVFERRQLQIAVDNGIAGVMLLDENLGESIDVAVGLSRATKINGLEDGINRFIAEKKADGTLDDMYMRWVADKNYTMPEISPAASPEFTIVVGTTGTVEPYSFYRNNELTGYDIEMARRFAAWLGADIKFKVIDYSGIIAAAQSGSIDCIFANLNVTDERKEAIDFSDPIYSIENGVMVAAVSVREEASAPSWIDSIILSFEKNFIREDRWRLIVEGIGTTCLIAVLSALFGSVLAFLICIFRRTGSRLANAISDIYVKLLQGTPIVVLLMILYYVVLGKSGLAAVWVAVIGFTLNFGAYASEIMRSGIESIDGGQREAALALGYNENQTFFRFIFPQAAVRFLPVYRGEIVSLLKSTSIVGYIAIQDLTKMSDIIRSRTYEAFFPLIATAIIYFVLAWIISLLLKFILKKVSPRRKRSPAE